MIRRTRVLALAVGGLLVMGAARAHAATRWQEVLVEYNGSLSRSEYFRVELVSYENEEQTTEEQAYVVFSKFDGSEVERLPVVMRQEGRGRPISINLLARGKGKEVRVNIRQGIAEKRPTVTVEDGSGVARKLVLLPNPKIRRAYHGYYSRSEYARVESVAVGTGNAMEKRFIVLSGFGSDKETYYPVIAWNEIMEGGLITEIVAGDGTLRLVIKEGDPATAQIQLPGVAPAFRPFTLIGR